MAMNLKIKNNGPAVVHVTNLVTGKAFSCCFCTKQGAWVHEFSGKPCAPELAQQLPLRKNVVFLPPTSIL